MEPKTLPNQCKRCPPAAKKICAVYRYDKPGWELVLHSDTWSDASSNGCILTKLRHDPRFRRRYSTAAKLCDERDKQIEYERGREYRQSPHGKKKMRQSVQRRRARKQNLPSTLNIKQWEFILTVFDDKCCYCGKKKALAQEHFIALVNGGGYTCDNILPACKSCNSSKGTKDGFEWFTGQKFYSKKREKLIRWYLDYSK